MAIEALTLALDGVIFDTEDLHLQACNAAFEHCGLGLQWSVQQLREATRVHGATHAVSALLTKLSISATSAEAVSLVKEKHRVFHDLVQSGGAARNPVCVQLMEDALDDGCKLAVVTDMPAQTATVMLEQAFGSAVTNMFAVVVSGADFNETGNGPYQLVLRTVGAEPSGCAAIDAAVPGLRAAQRAGIWTMAVTPYEKDIARITGADLWCPQLQELRHLIAQKRALRPMPQKFVTFDAIAAFKKGRLAAMATSNEPTQDRLAA
ncbi:MAG TPA: HAD hydrolase-like protein [Noviherbaspirillum sp.]